MAVQSRGGYSPLRDGRVIALGLVVLVWLSGAVAGVLTGVGEKSMAWPGAIITRDGSWSTMSTVLTVFFVLLGVAVAVWLSWLFKDDLKTYKTAATVMGSPKKLHHVTAKDAKATSKKIAPALEGESAMAGLRLGKTLSGGVELFLDWESTMLVIAGPRMGKTTAVALPAIITAPGAVITTSNKPDIYSETVDHRSHLGDIWLFDPQNVAGETNMWWNPLKRVTDYPSAQKLAGWLSTGAGNSAESNQANKYFQDEGEKLLAILILAAAKGKGDLKHVYDWLKDIASNIPVRLLAEAGFDNPAGDLVALQSMESRQRDGVIGFARQPVSLLTHDGFAQFVTPPERVKFSTDESGLVSKQHIAGLHEKKLKRFFPKEYATSKDTLYALSLEGMGSAAGLVTALTGEVLEEAVTAAGANGGRLSIPMVAVLDEAANVCRMGELPKQYSHFGSRGIIPLTILQSPAQARGVWGADGWEALKSASTVRYYGGNVDDDHYLSELATKIGDHDVAYSSRSTGRGGPSYSHSVQREKILDVSDLAALPKELAVVQSPGNKPVLIRKDFIFNNPQLQKQMQAATTKTPERSPQ